MHRLEQLLVDPSLLPFRIQLCKLGGDFLGVEEENLVGCLVLVAHVVHVEGVADIFRGELAETVAVTGVTCNYSYYFHVVIAGLHSLRIFRGDVYTMIGRGDRRL